MQIPNATTLTAKQKEDLITFICFKHQKNNLLNLRKVVGDEGLLTLLNKFASTFTKFPSITQIVNLANQLHMVYLYEELKAAAVSGDPVKWQEAENKFNKFCQSKLDLENYTDAKIQAKKYKKDIESARQWFSQLENWEKRNSPNG